MFVHLYIQTPGPIAWPSFFVSTMMCDRCLIHSSITLPWPKYWLKDNFKGPYFVPDLTQYLTSDAFSAFWHDWPVILIILGRDLWTKQNDRISLFTFQNQCFYVSSALHTGNSVCFGNTCPHRPPKKKAWGGLCSVLYFSKPLRPSEGSHKPLLHNRKYLYCLCEDLVWLAGPAYL